MAKNDLGGARRRWRRRISAVLLGTALVVTVGASPASAMPPWHDPTPDLPNVWDAPLPGGQP
jgi:hypothetical protein